MGRERQRRRRVHVDREKLDGRIRIKLEFFKPIAATNTADFVFDSGDGQTSVTWTMTGRNRFVAKAIGLVMDMDKMIGGMFEQGLARLKSIAEA